MCLTILAVLAATVVFSAVMVVPFAMNSIVKNADGVPRLAVTNRSSLGRGLPDSYYRKIARLSGVVAVNRMTWFGGVYDDPRHQFPSVGIDADNPDLIWPEYALDQKTVQRFKNAKDSAVVGVATMARFGWHLGDLVSLRQPAIPLTLTFRINGIITEGPDLTIFLFHRDYLEDALGGPKITSMLWVRCASMGDVSRIAGEIEEMFANSSDEVRAETEKAFLAQMVSNYAPLARLVQAIGLSAVIAIALAVLNAASMGVRERTREIAVMKSLGFTSLQIVERNRPRERNPGICRRAPRSHRRGGTASSGARIFPDPGAAAFFRAADAGDGERTGGRGSDRDCRRHHPDPRSDTFIGSRWNAQGDLTSSIERSTKRGWT